MRIVFFILIIIAKITLADDSANIDLESLGLDDLSEENINSNSKYQEIKDNKLEETIKIIDKNNLQQEVKLPNESSKIEKKKNKDKYQINKTYPIPISKTAHNFLTTDIPTPLLSRSFDDSNIHHPIMMTYNNKVNLLFDAVEKGDINSFNAVLRQVYNVNIYNAYGDTPLIFATSFKKYNMMASLLAAGANPNLKNKLGLTAVNVAIRLGEYEMLKLLVTMGADLNIKDSMGETYLMQSVRMGYLPIIDYLAGRDIDLNLLNNKNQTAFNIAKSTNNNVVMQILLKYGAKARLEKKKSIVNELKNKW